MLFVMKKVFSVISALLMILSCCILSFASDTNSHEEIVPRALIPANQSNTQDFYDDYGVYHGSSTVTVYWDYDNTAGSSYAQITSSSYSTSPASSNVRITVQRSVSANKRVLSVTTSCVSLNSSFSTISYSYTMTVSSNGSCDIVYH